MAAKFLVSVALVLASTASHASINAHPSSQQPEQTQQKPDLNNRVVTRALIYDKTPEGQVYPKCLVNTSGRPDLVPGFAVAAPAGFSSRIRIQTPRSEALPECDAETQADLARSAEYQVLPGTQVAYLGYILACGAAAFVGYKTYKLHRPQYTFDRSILPGGMMGGATSGFYNVFTDSGKSGFAQNMAWGRGILFGGVIGVVCHMGGSYVAEYFAEPQQQKP